MYSQLAVTAYTLLYIIRLLLVMWPTLPGAGVRTYSQGRIMA